MLLVMCDDDDVVDGEGDGDDMMNWDADMSQDGSYLQRCHLTYSENLGKLF